jgi:hypothetical protein
MMADGDALDPAFALPGVPIIECSLGAFLATVVIEANGISISILDLINYVSHVAGAVHIGEARSPGEMELDRLTAGGVTINGIPLTILQVPSIARVVLAALRPLKAAVESSGTTIPEDYRAASHFVSVFTDEAGVIHIIDVWMEHDVLQVSLDADQAFKVSLGPGRSARLIEKSPQGNLAILSERTDVSSLLEIARNDPEYIAAAARKAAARRAPTSTDKA